MDFWDVAKLMWRRWYVTAPALLLTAVAALWTGLNVEPDYQVTGHVAVVGSAVQRNDSDAAVTQINPWSPEALADAATIRLQGKPLADILAAEGFSGEWNALVTGRLPVIRLEVVAATPENAQATMERLVEVINVEVRDRQAEYNVAAEEQVTAVPYEGAETIEPVTGKVKRALIVVVGAGLVMTIGVVVAFDAIARRRRANTGDAAAPAPDQAPPPEAGGAERVRARYQYGGAAARNGSSALPLAGRPNGSRSGAAAGTRSHPVPVQYTESSASPVSGAPVSSAPASSPPGRSGTPDDATIVLPLSNSGSTRPPKDDPSSAPEL